MLGSGSQKHTLGIEGTSSQSLQLSLMNPSEDELKVFYEAHHIAEGKSQPFRVIQTCATHFMPKPDSTKILRLVYLSCTVLLLYARSGLPSFA